MNHLDFRHASAGYGQSLQTEAHKGLKDTASLPSATLPVNNKLQASSGLHCKSLRREQNPMSQPSKPHHRSRWNLLLLIPVAALIYPGLYARATPELAGVPFFYWYQFLWIILPAILTAIVYKAARH